MADISMLSVFQATVFFSVEGPRMLLCGLLFINRADVSACTVICSAVWRKNISRLPVAVGKKSRDRGRCKNLFVIFIS